MDENEKTSPPGIVFVRWGFLSLNPEQTEKIGKFENKWHLNFLNFSYWEQMDFELFVFNEILNTEQLELYMEDWMRRIKSFEDDLAATDNSENMQKEIAYEQEDIQYLETEFLPSIQLSFFSSFFMTYPYKTKFNFLRAEYKNYLDEKIVKL